ncbi:hypothetical protein [Bergeyella sp. RCAD1439]|uniref:hypothetical protein n=1 Tax=Bergeyella anatis TaxID=3113737 RepID=UPI002E193620|nr:hypothetical protein [Bergeyella sp. RCAD1439]
MKKIIEDINRVLADWNPIGVPEDIAIDEYKGYIPLILESIKSQEQLVKCLEDILIQKLELDYTPFNKEHSEDLQQACDKLIQVYQKTKAPE